MIATGLPQPRTVVGSTSRFRIGLAGAEDDCALRELMRNSAIEGSISVTFEREPSFFDSCAIRGDFFQVVASRDRASGKPIGLGTRSVASAFVNGKPTPLGYLSDLRLEPQYRGGTLIARGYRLFRELHEDGRARLYATVIFNDNDAALTTITTGRAGLPQYHNLGKIHSPGINIRGHLPPVEAACKIVRGCDEMLPEIVQCLNRNNSRRQFAPIHTIRMFRDRWCDFHLEDFHVALRGGSVIGVLGRWNQSAFKQTRVSAYRSRMRYGLPIANAFRRFTGAPRYPKVGEEVRYFYLSFIAVDDDNLQVFRSLLRSAYNSAVGREYLYAICALHERDPLLPALNEYVLTPFEARLFCVTFEDGESSVQNLDGRVPYLEASTF